MEKNKMGRPSKLTPLEKEAIFQKYLEGTSPTVLAYKFEVSVSTISRVIREKK